MTLLLEDLKNMVLIVGFGITDICFLLDGEVKILS